MKFRVLVAASALLAAGSAGAAAESSSSSPNNLCAKQVLELCPLLLVGGAEEDPLFGSFQAVHHRAACLGDDHAVNTLPLNCQLQAQEHAISLLLPSSAKNPCSDELHKVCGRKIDAWKKKVKSGDIKGAIQASAEVVECIIDNAQRLWEKCKPVQAAGAGLEQDCVAHAHALCPATSHKALGLGYTLACLHDHLGELGGQCTQSAVRDAVLAMRREAPTACRDAVQRVCGQQLDDASTTTTSITTNTNNNVAAVKALSAAQCIGDNAQALWLACSKPEKPTKEEPIVVEETVPMPVVVEETADDLTWWQKHQPRRQHRGRHHHQPQEHEAWPPHRRTHKPTHRPTRHRAEEEAKVQVNAQALRDFQFEVDSAVVKEIAFIPDLDEINDNAKPTKPPTKKRVVEEMVTVNVAVLLQQEEDDETTDQLDFSPGIITELNVDACVQVARRVCQQEVAELQRQPTSADAARRMSQCVDRHLDEIERQCVGGEPQVLLVPGGGAAQEEVYHLSPPCTKGHHGMAGVVAGGGERAQQALAIVASVFAFLAMMSLASCVFCSDNGEEVDEDEEDDDEALASSTGKPLLSVHGKA